MGSRGRKRLAFAGRLLGHLALWALAVYLGKRLFQASLMDPIEGLGSGLMEKMATLASLALVSGLLFLLYWAGRRKGPWMATGSKELDQQIREFYKRGDLNLLLGHLKLALKSDPKSPALRVNAGLALWAQGKKDLAQPVLESVIQGRPFLFKIRQGYDFSEVAPRGIRWYWYIAAVPLLLGMITAMGADTLGRFYSGYLPQYSAADFRKQFTPNFRVLYHHDSQVAPILEDIEIISEDVLGYLGLDESLWGGQPVNIYLVESKQELMARFKLIDSWVGGHADWRTRSIHVYPSNELMDHILPHELVHIALGVATKTDSVWVQEGIATYIGYMFYLDHDPHILLHAQDRAFSALRDGGHIPMEEFLATETVIDWDADRAAIYYTQALSLVYFLIKEYGEEKFHNFIAEMARGREPTLALSVAYKEDFGSFDVLESLWLVYFT